MEKREEGDRLGKDKTEELPGDVLGLGAKTQNENQKENKNMVKGSQNQRQTKESKQVDFKLIN